MNQLELHVITKSEQEKIQAILDSRVLDIKTGEATLHFNNGILISITAKAEAWKREKLSPLTDNQ